MNAKFTLFLEHTPPTAFANWLEKHTRFIHLRPFPTQLGRIELQQAKRRGNYHEPDKVAIGGYHIYPSRDGKGERLEHSDPVDMITFYLTAVSTNQTEVSCNEDTSGEVGNYYLELLFQDMVKRWPEVEEQLKEQLRIELPWQETRADKMDEGAKITALNEQRKRIEVLFHLWRLSEQDTQKKVYLGDIWNHCQATWGSIDNLETITADLISEGWIKRPYNFHAHITVRGKRQIEYELSDVGILGLGSCLVDGGKVVDWSMCNQMQAQLHESLYLFYGSLIEAHQYTINFRQWPNDVMPSQMSSSFHVDKEKQTLFFCGMRPMTAKEQKELGLADHVENTSRMTQPQGKLTLVQLPNNKTRMMFSPETQACKVSMDALGNYMVAEEVAKKISNAKESMPSENIFAKVQLPKRQANLQKWCKVWLEIKPDVTQDFLNAYQIAKMLEDKKTRRDKLRDCPISPDTLKKIIDAGLAGQLD